MTINTYIISKQIANSLKSVVVALTETNPVQQYSEANFGDKCRIYNQIATNKDEYTVPYIAINEMGQTERSKNQIQIDIDFAIPLSDVPAEVTQGIVEELVDGVIEYRNYYKLSEFAEEIVKRLETKGHLCYDATQKLFKPDEISIGTDQYSGTIQITFEYLTPISR